MDCELRTSVHKGENTVHNKPCNLYGSSEIRKFQQSSTLVRNRGIICPRRPPVLSGCATESTRTSRTRWRRPETPRRAINPPNRPPKTSRTARTTVRVPLLLGSEALSWAAQKGAVGGSFSLKTAQNGPAYQISAPGERSGSERVLRRILIQRRTSSSPSLDLA